ncbi:alpha/beta hydrolase [Pseudoduganella ginsengisoli]|uniref:Alpha/beta fold hydrolase n=1 Tax=Pseudoduganella ginsengisoli TaxID=1462440 RepID=A0A6L6Q4T6_9BURK|nr:alpha/beta hydrolase [Pseudoduganella ginsengisoli]MTW04555.1 alpha/beta fold hydrolase [Pseudoduganella ginsengisoli]
MKHLPARQHAVIDGQQLAYGVAGHGGPAIVLINGAGGPMEGWFRLFPDVAQLAQVFMYDRPGVGASGKPVAPQTAELGVRQLRALLNQAGVPGPYLLVAHSFGGLYANLFARLHPQDAAGVLFIEAAAPEDVGAMKAHAGPVTRMLNGLLNVFVKQDANGEVANETQSVGQIHAAPPFPVIPLTVLSGAKTPPGWAASPAALAARERSQQGLAALSPLGRRIKAQGSGHFPQMSEPKAVVDAIAALLESARQRV